MTAILCRYGELFLKGGNRGFFLRAMANNVRKAMRGLTGNTVHVPHGRIIVMVPDDLREEATSRLERVFGLVSVSPGVEVPLELPAITEAALAETRAAMVRFPHSLPTFKVESRRSNKQFPLCSYDLDCQMGGVIIDGLGLKVDVHRPMIRVGIEIGFRHAHVFADVRSAPGGLPVGVSGRALVLLSGGIDSPVATWLAAKRGLAQEALTFHSPPFTGERSKDKVVTLARKLADWQALSALWVVHFTDTQKRLREAGPAELAVVLYRRMMLRVADRLCERIHANAIVTGENLGQVASQTLVNMSVIDSAAHHLILRPLLTFDKMETIALARRIGTYDTSALPFEDCCSLFIPVHPATAARLSDVVAVEERLDIAGEAAALAEGAVRIELCPKVAVST
jgi:thiamine biosynthesis protein ThiI